ncbi:NifU-like protein [Syntrophus gentianae]|uniref:NifU-like protein n=1 Tax=Syntrophus gentianae TaxID=43775 RepID=A0A1H7V5L2_9BACT|nr:Fe-S cluster assembly protein NifU [Syntrophus gentianae]SEM04483.1 NifU-like protein [Syntrophus gentianae]
MWEYTDKVMEHFWNPRNVGEVENPDGLGEVGSIACGDALRLTFKVDENKRITEAKFKSFGCASAIAAASALTEMLKGLTVEDAEKITNQDIAASLGGLPKQKMHCSVLGEQVLEKAIAYYRGNPADNKEEMICECFGVTELEIQKALKENNLTTVEEVTNYTKAGGGCGSCHERIQGIIDWVRSAARKPREPKLITIRNILMVEKSGKENIEKNQAGTLPG